MVCSVIFAFNLTGCSVEEIQEELSGTNSSLKKDLSMEWFGRSDEESNRDGSSPYANNRDYITFNFDNKEVEESDLASLPEYDFSGPKGSNPGNEKSNQDESLLPAGTEEVTDPSAQKAANGKKVYIAPICCGLKSTGYLARTKTGYQKLKGSASSFSISDYKKALAEMKECSDTKNYGANRFKGKKETKLYAGGTSKDYSEWKASWDAAKRIGDQLKKDGCDVVYAYSATVYTNAASDPSTFWGDRKDWTVQDIAEDAAKAKPDYVLWIGFNEADFGASVDNTVTTHTIFVYGAGKGSKTFSKKVAKNWGKVSDLDASLPKDGYVKRGKYKEEVASVIGSQKADTCLTALEINGCKCKSMALLLGDYKTNSNSKTVFSYNKPDALYQKIAEVLEKSF